jgi:hypothetical protein
MEMVWSAERHPSWGERCPGQKQSAPGAGVDRKGNLQQMSPGRDSVCKGHRCDAGYTRLSALARMMACVRLCTSSLPQML